MKKILLLATVLFFSIACFSQENPCPTVSNVRRTNIVNNGNGTCSGTITLHITNDVSNSNPKGVRVEVLCSGSTTPVATNCFIASTLPGGADFTTDPFTCACNAGITVRITRFTASNGNCQGGNCGNVLIIQQSPLPVQLTSFTARRNSSMVGLNWSTGMEVNNSGYIIERLIGGGDWTEIATVTSLAALGNSATTLNYSYTDFNSARGISQYRIRQVDMDGQYKFSEVRAVRGEGQTGKTIVFPNPSADGKVKVVFEDASSLRDVTLFDLSGRIVKQWKGISNNNIQIDNLNPGVYSLKVVVPETGEQTVEKIVVNKH